MRPIPCPRCGYHAPQPQCPHCNDSSAMESLARPLRGPLAGIWDGFLALPIGMGLFLRTSGTKRWMLPPLLLTLMLLVLTSWWSFGKVGELMASNLPPDIVLDGGWDWLESLPGGWSWLQSTWAALVVGAEWILNVGWGFLISQPLRLLTWFLLGSLVMWYCFSIAYEALAGPFLDEVQSRFEARWFGLDPRGRLERPNDIPPARCSTLSFLSFGLFLGLALVFWRLGGAVSILLALPLAVLPSVILDRRFGPWLAWVASVEGRALWASLQATLLTTVLIVLALPLYFIPVAGYFLFAGVCGFATAVGLLDIPFERRGWELGQRARFVGRYLLPFLAFGTVAGLLLSIPIVGPILMVPSSSIGGLWLVCRLDKSFLR